MKNARRRRKHCALAVVRGAKEIAPPQTPFPGARDGQNLISWRRPLAANQFGEDRCTQFRVIVVTDPQTNKHTHTHTNRQERLQYTAPQLSAQCNEHRLTYIVLLFI